ncbi:YtxH domain-containing protein [Staphylococcus carnosus]|uniref:YtxH domain-containing protein n=2 Tax=Staphylococcus carnosus TaxID=1281 RepID=B9DN41_STACT|nr:YtxH domain-containing protein [Staphylococcus carnosus]KKB26006.1 hypothetical protein VV61_00545 [Staphylococcus carnosus]POA07960.1 YtxH domain-containing protein [Staphylococcus carnosus]QPT04379.1 YtxH domain-containing protein [Staphylococcus carnosus]QQS84971.1 YtxH domain-containing protein [Staphylococcus carnosus]QRQ04910.1 YtxH domain-containing protein [Staphylococcus carnosus]
MAKGSNFLKAVVGIGAAAAAVLLTRKDSREKLKNEYDKYKENPESYKQNAKDLASQIASNASETFNEVKENPKEYAEKVKQDPKGFVKEQKERFSNGNQDASAPTLDDAKQSDEPRHNIRIVTDEDLKNNENKSSDNDTK